MINVNYETITPVQMTELREVINSSILNAFTFDDYVIIVGVLKNVIERLKEND